MDSLGPVYLRIAQDLINEIEAGRLKPGDAVPSERVLCERYGVSRMTARHAVQTLVADRLLYQVKGVGTFVAHPSMQKMLTRLNSFSEDLTQRGYRASARVLVREVAPADERTSQKLQLQPGDPVFHLKRLRLADDEPLSIEDVHLPIRLVAALVDEDFERESLYRLLTTRCNIQLVRTEEEIRALPAAGDHAALLNMPAGSPLLATERLSFAAPDTAVEFGYCVYRADKYSFYIERYRE
jgi:GntR family transcriptional regulator